MQLRSIFFTICLLLIALPSMAKPIRVQIVAPQSADSPEVLATDYLLKLITERSQDRILARVNRTATTASGTLMALKKRQIELAVIDLADINASTQQLRLLELPFLFQSRQHLHRVLDSEIGRQVLLAAQQPEYLPLSVWDIGFHQLIADTRLPVPELLEGRGVTTSDKKATMALFLAIGAVPVAHAAEIDDNSGYISDILLTRQGTALPKGQQLTMTNHLLSASVLLIEKNFWQQLPDDLRIIVTGAIKDATSYFRELAQQQEQQALKKLKLQYAEPYQLSPEERRRWQTEALKLYPQLVQPEARTLVEQILRG